MKTIFLTCKLAAHKRPTLRFKNIPLNCIKRSKQPLQTHISIRLSLFYMYSHIYLHFCAKHAWKLWQTASGEVTKKKGGRWPISAATCPDIFTIYTVPVRLNTPKIIIFFGLLCEPSSGSVDHASARRGGRRSLPSSFILLHAAILTVLEWQARGRGGRRRQPWWWNRYT